MMKYNKLFKENAQGKICARFRLKKDGTPKYYPDTDEDDKPRRHYAIYLSLESPNKAKISSVTYKLDMESYDDPVIEEDDADEDFATAITSYGDYIVTVEVQIASQVYLQEAWLSDLLEEGHSLSERTPTISESIQWIQKH